MKYAILPEWLHKLLQFDMDLVQKFNDPCNIEIGDYYLLTLKAKEYGYRPPKNGLKHVARKLKFYKAKFRQC